MKRTASLFRAGGCCLWRASIRAVSVFERSTKHNGRKCPTGEYQIKSDHVGKLACNYSFLSIVTGTVQPNDWFLFPPHNLRMECWFYSLDLCFLLNEKKTVILFNLLPTGNKVRAILYFVRTQKNRFPLIASC